MPDAADPADSSAVPGPPAPAQHAPAQHAADQHADPAQAISLIRHLRELARARREPVRDIAACEQVHWLADLPSEVYVENDAAPGDVLFSVPVIPLSPPAVLEEFDGWLGLRRWYRTLRALADQGPAAHEVLLATGLLSWQPAEGVRVRDHLLTTPVRVVLDERTERVDVLPTGRTALRDRELLDGLQDDPAGFRAARTEWLRDAVFAGQGCGLQDSLADVLRKWCTSAFEEPVTFRDDWAPEPPPSSARANAKVCIAPALVVRQPGQYGLTDFFDALLAELSQPGAEPPLGFARLLDAREPERLLHVEDNSPQAVADLLTGLLARGRRVLVATSTPAEVHTALPADLAPLCVPVIASTPPEVPTAELTARFESYDPYGHEQLVDETSAAETSAAAAIAELQDRLGRLSETQTYDVAPGHRGTLAEITAQIERAAADHGWLPVRPDSPLTPPLPAAEAAELLHLLARQTPARAARTTQLLPEPASLPSEDEVRALVDAETAARARARSAVSPGAAALVDHLRSADPALLDRLDGCTRTVAGALRDLGLGLGSDRGPDAWDTDDWAVRALNDGLTRRGPTHWDRLAELAGRAAEAERALRMIGPRQVVLPIHHDLPALVAAARALREFLTEGGILRRGPLKPAAQRQAEPLLSAALVNDEPPTTPESLDMVLAALSGRIACRELAYAWEAAGVVFAADAPLSSLVAEFAKAYARLSNVRTALLAIDETKQLLDISITNLNEWHIYTTALASVRLLHNAANAGDRLAALHRAITMEIRKGQEPPELHAAAAALASRDVATYENRLAALSEAHGERLQQARCDTLLNQLRATSPDLADLMSATAKEDAWPDRLARWDAAWTWAHVSAFLANRPQTDSEARLRTALDQATERHQALGAELASVRAWGWCLSRMSNPAPTAVPAWLVPLPRIPGLPFQADSFDVVIVDHEPGLGGEALFLLWFAPRVIVVGPPNPPVPPARPVPPTPLPSGLDEAITPTASLHGVLAARSTPDPTAKPGNPPPTELRSGRSIATYKREELVELLKRLAAEDPTRTAEQLVAYARSLLDCPEDEYALVGARLRYALDHL